MFDYLNFKVWNKDWELAYSSPESSFSANTQHVQNVETKNESFLLPTYVQQVCRNLETKNESSVCYQRTQETCSNI